MSTSKIKILIADDSVVYRSQIRAALTGLDYAEVVGVASNGRAALERLQVSPVDLMILDLEMPEMGGIDTLKELAKNPGSVKVLVFSSASKRGAEITFEALRLGASDFVPKPALDQAGAQPHEMIRALFEPKLRAIFHTRFAATPAAAAPSAAPAVPATKASYPTILWDLFKPEVVVIASSTGGPAALEKIFSGVKGPFRVPVVIAQHMPPIFTAALAERLARLTGVPAAEAIDGQALEPNRIYVAPGDFHLHVEGTRANPTLRLDKGPQIHSVRPAADHLLKSAARIFRGKCMGLVLTGMGIDGKDGAEDIKRHGGAVAIQSQESCVVFGMPGAVHAAGAYDKILNLEEISKMLAMKIAGNVPLAKAEGA